MINFKNIQVTDMDWVKNQYPEYEDTTIIEANWLDTGIALTEQELEDVSEHSDFVYEQLQNFLH